MKFYFMISSVLGLTCEDLCMSELVGCDDVYCDTTTAVPFVCTGIFYSNGHIVREGDLPVFCPTIPTETVLQNFILEASDIEEELFANPTFEYSYELEPFEEANDADIFGM